MTRSSRRVSRFEAHSSEVTRRSSLASLKTNIVGEVNAVSIKRFAVNIDLEDFVIKAEKCALLIDRRLSEKVYGAAGRKAHAAIAGAWRW